MEEKKNEVCKVDANFVRQEIGLLMKSNDVRKLLYWQEVLKNAEEVKVEDETKDQ